MKNDYTIQVLCQHLEVSCSGYYRWRERDANPSPSALVDVSLAAEIEAIHDASRQSYGSPRIADALQKRGKRHGRNRIARLMREQGLCGRQKGRYRVQTTDSNHDHPIAPNLLAEAPAPTAVNQIWVGDITYIQTGEGWLYLAGVLDLFSRRIVGWAMSEWIDTPLTLGALHMALTHRQPPPGLLFHSDRGVQYAANDYRAALADANLVASMSRKGNCCDNAFMESFWSSLKIELVYRHDFQTHAEARAAIFDYIEVFYNRQRAHTSISFLPPAAFEHLNTQK